MVNGFLAGAAGGGVVAIVIKAVDQFSKTLSDADTALLKLGTAITAVGIAGGVAVGGLLKVAGQFEQTQIAFTTMLGSAEEGNKLLKELADFAAKTPFTIPGIEANAKQLLAMGISTEKLLPTLKSLGDIASGLNVPMNRLALNFGQVKVQGKLTGRELRDFSVAGVPLIAELSKNLGKSEEVIKEMVSAGEIGFKEVEKAFETMTSEGGKFFDLMDAQSKTFLGQVSNIQDSFIKVARVMGQVFLPAAKFVAQSIQVIIGWFEQHPTISKFLAIILGLVTAFALIVGPLLILKVLFPFIIGFFVTGAAAMWGLVTASLAFIAVNIVWIAIIAAVIAVIFLLVKAFNFLRDNWYQVTEFFKKTGVDIKNVFIGIANTVFNIWNKIINFIQKSINRLIDLINSLIKQLNVIPGIDIESLRQINLGRFKAASIQTETFTPTPRQAEATTEFNINIENVSGMDPTAVAEALENVLKDKINF